MKASFCTFTSALSFNTLKPPRSIFTHVATVLKLQNLEGWYSITKQDLSTKLGKPKEELDRIFGADWVDSLVSSFPEHDWKPWKFAEFDPSSWGKSAELQRNCLDDIAKLLGVKTWEDWYKVSRKAVESCGGSSLVSYHRNSVARALCEAYPQYPWQIWRFKEVPSGFFNQSKVRRQFLDYVSSELHLQTMDDWYQVSKDDILARGGGEILKIFGGSVARSVINSYPEHNWDLQNFKEIADSQSEKKFDSEESSPVRNRDFFDELGKKFGLKDWTDWYHVSSKDVQTNGGLRMLNYYYGGSIIKALEAVYPEHPWRIWKFIEAPKRIWDERKLQRAFFDELYQQLKLKSWQDWYKVSRRTIEENGGLPILKRYSASLPKALSSIYPEHDWKDWQFEADGVAYKYWNTKKNQRKFLDQLAKKLHVNVWEDWYDVKISDLELNDGGGLLGLYSNSVMQALRSVYPEHNWEEPERKRGKSSKSQTRLFKIVQELFRSATDIHVNYIHEALKYARSGLSMELDIYIPSLSLAFEYQGEQHYIEQSITNNDLQLQQSKDVEKREKCQAAGITLIEVPFWWNGTLQVLLPSSLKRLRILISPTCVGLRYGLV
eukprot:TRINITY_DN6476_c0_g1_i1.p1 TRINITY_DN6476_c0_g1~~TRINITY_DN6476_c0_g1_i1.p1  ORF type:complete len:606 (-),score=129.46 TRINITY_DN6476_c0_g1_i1:43-1860(-)